MTSATTKRRKVAAGQAPKALAGSDVYVIDAWDDDAQESYVRVFTSAEKATRALERWEAKREGHNLFAGVVRRKVL